MNGSTGRSWRAGLLVLLATWGVFFVWLWPRMLFHDPAGVLAGWSGVWGDWAAHFAYAAPFAYRPPSLWLAGHPLYHGRRFSYPFAVDAISGLLIRAGASPVAAFVVPSIVTSLLFLAALYALAHRVLRAPGPSVLAVTLFLAGGGMAFWPLLTDLLAAPSPAALRALPDAFDGIAGHFMSWNVVGALLLSQRAFLLGMPLGAAVLVLLLRWGERRFAGVPRLHIALAGAATGLLALVHVHTCLALLAVGACLVLWRPRHLREWLVFAVPAALVALAVHQALYAGQLSPRFMRWYPGWLARSRKMGVLEMWWLCWGPFLPLSLVALARTRLYRHPFVAGGALLFLLGNLVLFQPFDWDNTKVLAWAQFALALPTARYLARMWRAGAGFRAAAALLVLSLTASGLLDLWRVATRPPLLMWTSEEIDLARRFRAIAGPVDRVLAADNHNHWAATLTGRPVLLGYKGWMWTYGINYEATARDVVAMLSGAETAPDLLRIYGVRYAVIGPVERRLGARDGFFRQRFPRVLESPSYRVYRIEWKR